jgi:hypothetical protein
VNTPVWEFKAPNVSADTPLRFQLNITDNLGQVSTAFVNVLDKPAPLTSEQSHSMAIHPLSKMGLGENENASNTLPLSIPSMLQTRLDVAKITSPIKGQHVPVHSSLVMINNNSKPLISIDLQKNPITAGDIETLKIMVTDAAVSNVTIAGARERATVTDPTNTITTKFNGTTDNSGIFTHTWRISKDSKPGVFTVSALTSATGYRSLLIPTRATFIVSPAVVQQEIVPQQQHKTFNCRFFIVAPGPCA